MVMYFSYNGTRDWLKSKWRDHILHEAKTLLKINTTNILSRFGAPFLPSIDEKRDCLSTSPAYEIPLNWSNLLGENLSKYKHGTLRLNLLP